MQSDQKLLMALGRIEGELIGIRQISERVRVIEAWLWWLRGAWAVLAVVVYLCSRTQ